MNIPFFKIPLKIHWSWWCFVAMIFLPDLFAFDVYKLIFKTYILIVSTFFLIGHELSHVWVTNKYGLKTKEIMLHFFGGVALLDMKKVSSSQEFYIAAAGPAFNLISATLLFVLAMLNPFDFFYAYNEEYDQKYLTLFGQWYAITIIINIAMGLFNLIPAYPMDGGRMLRSLFKDKYSKYASNVSNGLTIGISVLFIVGSFVTANPGLFFMALLLLLGVLSERKGFRF